MRIGAFVSTVVAWIGTPAFRRVYRFDRALRRKLTPAGWLLGGVLVGAMVFGLNTRETQLYQLFALAAGLLLVAAIAALWLPLRVRVQRRLPASVTAGVPFDYTVTVTNLGPRALPPLRVEDLPAWPRVTGRAFARYKVAADRERNIFDRLIGYPRWVSYMRERIGASLRPGALPALAPGASAEVKLQCRPLRRGVVTLDSLILSREEPLGLMRAQRWQRLRETLVVLPRTYPVAPVDMPGSRRLQPGGVSFAGHVGDAEEFVSLRDYRDGDGPRRIHWKAWARTGQLVVKETQEEYFVRHALVLDTFGTAESEAFEAAVSIAASLVLQPRAADSLLDLVFVEDRAYTFTQGRGLGAPPELLRVLATVAPAAGHGFATLAESVLLASGRLSGVICVLLAWDAARQELVAALRRRGLPVRVWLVADESFAVPAEDPRHFRIARPGELAQALGTP